MSSFVYFRSCAGEALLRDATEVAPVPFPDQQATRPVPVPHSHSMFQEITNLLVSQVYIYMLYHRPPSFWISDSQACMGSKGKEVCFLN